MNDLFEVAEKTTVITKTTKFDKTERNNYICKMYDISFDEIVDEFMVNFETNFDWNIGLIVGQSGTGKTTIAKELVKKLQEEGQPAMLLDGDEIRDIFKHTVWYNNIDNIIINSKKLLSDYLTIIKTNMEIKKNMKANEKIWYNLFSSQAVLFPIKASPSEPFDDQPIEKNSEILVSIPHLTPDYFVLCK